ncbi:MAG TPA: PAS domain S-box protein, partial [Chryseosolibacter sp.]|nr:PAS domain S-box protein [Chryseosolibacter sp.]
MVYSKRRKSGNKEGESTGEPAGSVYSKPAHEEVDSTGNDGLLDEVVDYAIIRLNPKGEVMTWNKGAEKIKGYRSDEIIGKNYRIFYTAEDKSSNLSETLLNEAKKNGSASYEGWRVRKDGNRFWGSMTLTALHHSDGSLKGFLKITRDLTDKKTADDMQSNYVEELKQKNTDLKKSEDRYHKMITEVVDYAIILLDNEGTILDWNKGAEKLKGYRPDEIIGKNFRLFYPKESKDQGLPDKLLNEARERGSVVHEGWRLRKDGKRFWGSVAITALHDDAGNVMGFSKVTRDLTERKIAEDRVSNLVEELKQANAKLQESEERYHRMILEIEDYAIILLDENGNIQNWNAGAQAIKGYTSKEIIGKHFKIFYRKEDQKDGLADRLLNEARKNGKVSHEGWRVRKDGSQFWGSIVITALHDATGKVIGFSKVTRDLTEKKLAEDALRSTAAQLDLKNKTLERLNEELASFSHASSHDLKEPLRKIETFANRIKDVSYNPQKSEEFVNKIIDSAGRMRRLIENLLAYSQVSNEEQNRVQVDLNKIVNAIKGDL